MALPPIYLTIRRIGDLRIAVDLLGVGSLIPRSETLVEEAFLQELTAALVRLSTSGYSRREGQDPQRETVVWSPISVSRDLQQIGGLIFSHLLTEPVRKRLRTAEPCDLYLRLDEQLIQVPWELCYGQRLSRHQIPGG
jgi:hypothetical protein